MTISLGDLTVLFNSEASDTLTGPWTWLIGKDKKVLMVTAIGDMFLTDNGKKVYWLNVGSGELKLAADSIADFEESLKNVEQVNEWFMIDFTTELRFSVNKLKEGQVYSYKKLPIIGGDYIADNFAPLDIAEHFGYLGEIHRKLKDLPPGTKVVTRTVD